MFEIYHSCRFNWLFFPRLSTIKYADQIAVLDKGSIKECGTYDELMAIENGVFKKLIEKQAIGWREDSF